MEICRTLPEKPVEPFSEIRVLNFVRVGAADGRDVVRVDDRALHEVYRVVIFEVAVGEILPVNPKHVLHDVFREDALVFEIVNGEYGADALIALVADMVETQVHVYESGVPVVRVDDVGPEIHLRQEFQYRAAEKREPFRVVAVAVKAVAIEIVLIVDEIERDAVQFQLVDAEEFRTP